MPAGRTVTTMPSPEVKPAKVKLTKQGLSRAERKAAEQAANEAVERVRRQEAAKRCPNCGAPVLRTKTASPRPGMNDDYEEKLLDTGRLAYSFKPGVGALFLVPGDHGTMVPRSIRVADDTAVHREHRCSTSTNKRRTP